MIEQKKRIAFVSLAFKEVDRTVLKELQRYFQIDWYVINNSSCFSDNYFKDYVKDTDIKLHLYKYNRQRDFVMLQNFFNICMNIIKNKDKIIFTCDVHLYWCICYSLFLKHSNMVFGIHDVILHSDWKMSIFSKISRAWTFRRFNHFVLYSKNQQSIFDKLYKKDNRLVYMSTKDFGACTSTRPSIVKKVKLLFWGNIQPYKGLDLLIDVVEKIQLSKKYNFELTISGNFRTINSTDKTYPNLCKSKMKTSSLYKTDFRFISNDEIPNLLNSHHFLILPYRDSTQSGPLMAAINYKLPVVAPNFGCFTEMLGPDTSILYGNDTIQSNLEDAILHALEMTEDSYNILLDNCALLKEKFSEEKIALNYKEYFDELIDNNTKK